MAHLSFSRMFPVEFVDRERELEMDVDDSGELSGSALDVDRELAQRASELNLNDVEASGTGDEDAGMA